MSHEVASRDTDVERGGSSDDVVVRARRVAGAGLNLAVYERGDASAPTVVLLHGYPDTHAVWDLVADRLAPHAHTVAYDVRGAGDSDAPVHVDGYKLDLLMGDLDAVLAAVSPDRPVHLVGHDWGSLQGWEAVTCERLRGRFASYTSISGPSLDHVSGWVRSRLRERSRTAVRDLASQAVRSSYIAAFHFPGVAWGAELASNRMARARRVWAKGLATREDAQVDDAWPPPTFGHDLANGMGLYRANIGPKLRSGADPNTDVPVQLIVAEGDRFVPPRLVEGLETASPRCWRRVVPYSHWVPRSHPDEVAQWVTELVDHLEGGPEAPALAAARLGTDDGRTP